jgi:fatty acid desaturase
MCARGSHGTEGDSFLPGSSAFTSIATAAATIVAVFFASLTEVTASALSIWLRYCHHFTVFRLLLHQSGTVLDVLQALEPLQCNGDRLTV